MYNIWKVFLSFTIILVMCPTLGLATGEGDDDDDDDDDQGYSVTWNGIGSSGTESVSSASALLEKIKNNGGSASAQAIALALFNASADGTLTSEASKLVTLLQNLTWQEQAKLLNTLSDMSNRANGSSTGGGLSSQSGSMVIAALAGHMGAMQARAGNASVNSTYAFTQKPHGPAMAAGSGGSTWAAWGETYGGWVNQDDRGSTNGYDTSVFGLVVGIDKQMTENLLLGFSLSAGDADIDFDDSASELDTDNYSLGIYASYATRTWFVDGTISYGWTDNDSRRETVLNATEYWSCADYDSDQWTFSLGGGMVFEPAPTWSIIPSARITYSYYDQESYTERGGSFNDLQVNDYDTDSFTTELNLKIAKLFKLQNGVQIVPSISIGWIHEFEDPDKVSVRYYRLPASIGTFKTRGLDPADNSFVAKVGVNIIVNERVSTYLNYDLELKNDYDSHVFSGGLRVNF